MIQRIDRLGVELPPPSDPDPNGAAAVQELMGGKFGEMSTFMNYSFQSFNFRGRQSARPFYDLVANIAAEEFGHIELVAATIKTMLTAASPVDDGKAPKASLAALAVPDARRFRMTIAIDGAQAWEEHGWTGREIAVGDAVLRGADPVGRCVVTTRDPDTGSADQPTLKALARLRGKHDVTFGIWCEVVAPAAIRVGDPVTGT